MSLDTLDIGSVGIWQFQLDLVPSGEAIEVVDELDELGFGAVWIPEAVGREAFTSAGILLRGGTDIVVASIKEHDDAGADHVCIQVIDGGVAPNLAAWRDLAAALMG